MAFPTVVGVTTTTGTGSQTLAVNMPASGVEAGDLLLAIVTTQFDLVGGGTMSGFTQVGADNDGDNCRLYFFAKNAVGTENGTTVTYTSGDSANSHAAQVYHIQNWIGGNVSTGVEVGTFFSGTVCDPPSKDPTNWGTEDTLWLCVGTEDINATTTADISTNYTNGIKTGSGNRYQILSGRRNLNAASENPAAFTNVSPGRILAATVAIRPAIIAPRSGQVSWVEFETPPKADRQGRVSHIELETTDFNKRAQISFLELETPDLVVGSFPTVQSVTETTTANVAQMDVLMPGIVNAGDLLLAIISTTFDTTGGVGTLSGFTSINQQNDGDNCRWYIFAKNAVGNEDGTTVPFVPGDAAVMTAQVYRITNWRGGSVATAVEATSAFAGTTQPDPPNLDPVNWGAEDTLWIAVATEDINELTASTLPANYGSGLKTSNSNGVRSQILSCTRNLNTNAENPSIFGTMSTSGRVFTMTIAVRPFVATDRVGRVSFLELETPDFDRRGQVSYIEFLAPDVGGAGGGGRGLGLGLGMRGTEAGE